MENSIIQHLGYIFTFLALSVKDVLWLRIILATAQITLGIYQFIEQRYDVVFWNGVFTLVNLYHIIRIINDRKPVLVPNEIKDIYENIFFNLTTKEFMDYWNLGEPSIGNDSNIINEGEKQENLFLILEGRGVVTQNSNEIASLNRGDFIAEISFLTEEPASANVFLSNDVKYIKWSQEQIREFQTTNIGFWSKLHHVLSRDLIKKIKS
tara:strand:+ start:5049 stop:5675 length:627 start_codon:yes stop_codon:yes gene_type:complete